MALIDLKNCTFAIIDGTDTPQTMEITIGEGNVTWSEKRNIEYHLNRGSLTGAGIREGDEVPVDVSFQFQYDYISVKSTTATFTVEDFIKGTTNGTGTLESTDSDACAPYACDITITNAPTPTDCGDQEVVTLSAFRWESLDHDPKAGTISCSGKCAITEATVARTTQS